MPSHKKYKSFKDDASPGNLPSSLQDQWIDDEDEEEDGDGDDEATDGDEETATREEIHRVSHTSKPADVEMMPSAPPRDGESEAPMPAAVEAEPNRRPHGRCQLLLRVAAATSALLLLALLLSVNPSTSTSPSPTVSKSDSSSPLPPPPPPEAPPLEKFWLRPLPPPPPLDVQQIVADLNTRFADGRASNVLSEAGVMLHTFDATDAVRGGRVDVWNPCPESWWCADYADRLSASLVNTRLRSFFWAAEIGSEISAAMGGFVLDARAMEPSNSSILCAWGADAGTMGMKCHPMGVHADGSCIPGCRAGQQCSDLHRSDHCWQPPYKLKDMVEKHEARARTEGHGCNQFDCKCVRASLHSQLHTITCSKSNRSCV